MTALANVQRTGVVKELAKVQSVFFGLNDYNTLTIYIALDFGGATQSFGGYMLDTYNSASDTREGAAHGLDLFLRVLHLFGVSELKDIVGRNVYALYDDNNHAICGLELPPFDGGRKLLLADWLKRWDLK